MAGDIQTADKGVRTVKLTKSFDRPFLKGRGFLGRSPESTSAEVEIPLTSKKFLFLVLFLLAKGEKEYD